MSKTNKIASFIFLLVLVLLTYLEAKEPDPINWSPTYAATDKIPFGSFVLYNSLPEVFNVEPINQPPYEFLSTEDVTGTYFFLNDQLLFDEQEVNVLLDWIGSGNTAFLASDAFNKKLLDTLKLNVETAIPLEGVSSKPMFNLANPELKNEEPYLFDRETYHSVFSEIDTINHTVLGISELYSDTLAIEHPEINFLKASFGEGEIYLNTTPQAFTNFFLLEKDNITYVQKALGYLPSEETIFWDAYHKTGKRFTTSPLSILLGTKELKWAYYFLILGSILFILFEGKRKQRSIPVIKPLENQTYNFTRTISGLFLESRDYTQIARKKIYLFMDFIRSRYRVPIDPINTEFYSALAAQTGRTESEARDLFDFIQMLEQQKTISKEDLLQLNSAIQHFKDSNNEK